MQVVLGLKPACRTKLDAKGTVNCDSSDVPQQRRLQPPMLVALPAQIPTRVLLLLDLQSLDHVNEIGPAVETLLVPAHRLSR